jgi:hypothetical protein
MSATKSLKSSSEMVSFVGNQQPSYSRAPAIAPVNYKLGGSDFRCPALNQTSSFGRQAAGKSRRGPDVPFAQAPRFGNKPRMQPGPNLKQVSAMGRQQVSTKRTAGTSSFGTSTRAGALKLYAIYNQ